MSKMKEKLQEFALIAEIVGGAAVLITLIFLVVETRENTNSIQAQTYQSLMSELNQRRESVSSSTEIAAIQIGVMQDGFESLNQIERYRFRQSRMALWGVYESAYFARERGILGDAEWSRFYSLICLNYVSEGIIWGSEDERGSIANSLTAQFRAHVEDSCN